MLKLRKGRVRVLFNTGTRVHKNKKAYTRKVKHKKKEGPYEPPL